MQSTFSVSLNHLEATRKLAEAVATCAGDQLTIALTGALGAGKTQWARYYAECLGVPKQQVTSPTYVLLQRYSGHRTIYHFDWYRLESTAQVWDLGIDELYEQPINVLIEWADKFPECLPPDCLTIHFVPMDDGGRSASVLAKGERSRAVLEKLRSR